MEGQGVGREGGREGRRGEGFEGRRRKETCHLARSSCAFSNFLKKENKGGKEIDKRERPAIWRETKERDLPLSKVGAIGCRLEHRLCMVWCVPAWEGRGGRDAGVGGGVGVGVGGVGTREQEWVH